MSSLDPIAVQKDEVVALRNIFGKELKLYRPKNIKKKYEPPYLSIIINVSPSSSADKGISLKLHFDCSLDYPLSSPKISISDTSGIPSDFQDNLMTILNQKSFELRGVPMMHNLVEEAREIIQKRLDKPLVMKNTDLLHDENKQSELNLQLLRQRRDSAMKETKKDNKFEKCFHQYRNTGDIVELAHCHDRTAPLQIYKGVCEGDHRVKLIDETLQLVFSSFEGFNMTGGSSARIYQISISNMSKKRAEFIKLSWLPKLEEDFSLLYKLAHPNISTYLGFHYQVREKQLRKKKKFDIDIQYVTQNNGGMKLSTLCDLEIKGDTSDISFQSRLPVAKIKTFLKSVIHAVHYLHDKNITYIKINLDSIIVDRHGQLIICHYYIGKRFEELKRDRDKEETQEAISSVKKGSKRHDLKKVAILAKQLFFYGLPETDADESEMPSDLIDFISSLNSNIEDLHNHPFLCFEKSIKKTDHLDERVDLKHDLSPWEIFEKSSRIPKEFELICKLGEGAFGDVVKVKNIYDNQYYAIKRVRLNAINKKATRTMKEVQLLSSLNHENIVRYYASWSEEIIADNSKTISSDSCLQSSSSTRNNLSNAKSIRKPDDLDSDLLDLHDTRKSFLFSNNEIYSQMKPHSCHFDLESYSDSESESESGDESENRLKFDRQSDEIYFERSVINDSIKPNIDKSQYMNDSKSRANKSKKVQKFLMIQMELCEGRCNTLQKYIEEQKLYLNEKLIWRFIREIVSGLEHIHSKNMIHRDLKPNNIFLDAQKRVKIGDLGLAMKSPKIAEVVNQDAQEEQAVSGDTEKGPVGTMMYICPEMLSHTYYTNKADMYSLGIIIFEMCHKPFFTNSERYHILNQIRQPEIILPDEKQIKISATFRTLICSLLNHDPAQRPSASELLRSSVIPPPEGKEMECRNLIKEVTKCSSSNLYKYMLSELFTRQYIKEGRYELPVLHQPPFKYYLSNTKLPFIRMMRKELQFSMDEGDNTFFTLKRLINRYIESVFVAHGAVEFKAPLLSANVSRNESHVFSLLDSEGVVVNLPDNLRVSFANFLINNNISSTRRYAIGSIYHQQEYRRDHPRELIEAAFDIVTDYDNCDKTVEVIYVLHQIFNKILNLEHVQLDLEVNHTGLIYGVMHYYKIPAELHQIILASPQNKDSSEINYLDTDHFRRRSTLNENQLSNLKSILRFNGHLEEFEKYLKIFLNKANENEFCHSITKGFMELRLIEEKLSSFQENCCFSITIRPTFVPLQSIYRGFVFQMWLTVQERFFDLVKSSSSKNSNLTKRYLGIAKVICVGGKYSDYLTNGNRSIVSEYGDIMKHISAVGSSIDISILLQTIYSMEQLYLSSMELEHVNECLMNCAVSVVVQYDSDNDKIIGELMTKLWAAGLPTELYDKDDKGEEYAFNQKINFFVKFLSKSDKRSNFDNRIFIKKNDCKSMGFEQICAEEIRTISKALDFILKESKKIKDNVIGRLEKEQNYVYQKQLSENAFIESNIETDVKKSLFSKTESVVGRYLYKFISAKEGRFNSPDLFVNYLIETGKHMQSINAKHPDLDLFKIQLIVKLNSQLINLNKWFQGRFPNPLFSIIVEVSYSKCLCLLEEVSLKTLKDTSRLSKIFTKIESTKNYSSSVEKQWKDVITSIWEALQNAVKEKYFRVVIYSQNDDQSLFLDIK